MPHNSILGQFIPRAVIYKHWLDLSFCHTPSSSGSCDSIIAIVSLAIPSGRLVSAGQSLDVTPDGDITRNAMLVHGIEATAVTAYQCVIRLELGRTLDSIETACMLTGVGLVESVFRYGQARLLCLVVEQRNTATRTEPNMSAPVDKPLKFSCCLLRESTRDYYHKVIDLPEKAIIYHAMIADVVIASHSQVSGAIDKLLYLEVVDL